MGPTNPQASATFPRRALHSSQASASARRAVRRVRTFSRRTLFAAWASYWKNWWNWHSIANKRVDSNRHLASSKLGKAKVYKNQDPPPLPSPFLIFYFMAPSLVDWLHADHSFDGRTTQHLAPPEPEETRNDTTGKPKQPIRDKLRCPVAMGQNGHPFLLKSCKNGAESAGQLSKPPREPQDHFDFPLLKNSLCFPLVLKGTYPYWKYFLIFSIEKPNGSRGWISWPVRRQSGRTCSEHKSSRCSRSTSRASAEIGMGPH